MIEVRRGALSEQDTEALLRPVSSEGDAVSAVGRGLDAGAGEEVALRLRDLGDLPVGGGVITPAGDLEASFLIHVAVQSADEAVSAAGLRRALLNGLRRASEWEIESVALPPLGAGPGSLDAEEAAGLVVDVLTDHLREGGPPHRFRIVVENGYEEELFRRLLAASGTG